ncbi:uncharacterized protein [Cherax quadricarinatus]|nr:uncharacterized protein LOC128685363 isoform X2 [Cherax quadricarinatus]
MDIESLVKAEVSDRHTDAFLVNIAKELKLFDDSTENETKPLVLELPVDIDVKQQRNVVLQPPGVPFFTKRHHHLYTEDTLIWPFQKTPQILADLKPPKIKKYICEDWFMRGFPSQKTVILLIRYLFHTMCCTMDSQVRHSAYSTICYLLTIKELQINMIQDYYLAFDNLGADLSKLKKDVSNFTSPVIPSTGTCLNGSDKRIPLKVLKETISLILQLQVLLLTKKKYESKDADNLICMYLAIGLDPRMIDVGMDNHIANCVANTLSLYTSDESFYQYVQSLAKNIIEYGKFDHLNVSHICSMYLSYTATHYGRALRSAVAIIQAQISLQREELNIFDVVDVQDVAQLVEEQLQIFYDEEDGCVLHSVMKLMDFCITDEPLSAARKKELKKIVELINPIASTKRDKVDDVNITVFRFFAHLVIKKWRGKMGAMGRQQTLDELHVSSTKNGDVLN